MAMMRSMVPLAEFARQGEDILGHLTQAAVLLVQAFARAMIAIPRSDDCSPLP